MGLANRKWSDDQRAAIEHAWIDLNIKPRAEIVRMAAAGELAPRAGADRLPAFEIPYSTACDIGERAARRRRGEELRPELRSMKPKDRAESLSLRLTGLVDAELLRMEKEKERNPRKPLDAQHSRDMARLIKEIATIPDASEKRLPTVPGQRDADGKQAGATRGGKGASIIAALDGSGSPTTRQEQTKSSLTSESTATTTKPTDSQPQDHDHEQDQDDQPDDESCYRASARVPVLGAAG